MEKLTDNPTKEQLAALLRDRRHEMKLTGGEVSRRLRSYGIEISEKTLWGYEHCVSSPAVPTFLALCRIYEIEDILTEAGRKPARMELNERERALLTAFRAASPELQAATLRMLTPGDYKP